MTKDVCLHYRKRSSVEGEDWIIGDLKYSNLHYKISLQWGNTKVVKEHEEPHFSEESIEHNFSLSLNNFTKVIIGEGT